MHERGKADRVLVLYSILACLGDELAGCSAAQLPLFTAGVSSMGDGESLVSDVSVLCVIRGSVGTVSIGI